MSVKQKLAYVIYYSSVVMPIYDIIVGIVKGIYSGVKAIREEVKLAQEKAEFEAPQDFDILSDEECRKIFDLSVLGQNNVQQ